MKNLNVKNLVILVVIISSVVLLSRSKLLPPDELRIIRFLIGGTLLGTFLIRKIPFFKPYFVSKYNILTTKVNYNNEFDFSKSILFEKLKEVMEASNFKIIQANESTGDIFAITNWTRRSYGENIYVNLKEVNGKTNVSFCSVTVFQIYSWGKNKRNYEIFLEEFEKSLII